MVLRASGQAIGENYHIDAVVHPSQDSGVAAGRELLAYADALLNVEGHGHAACQRTLRGAQDNLATALGAVAVSGAALVVGAFSKNDRIANGIGIPMDGPFLEQSTDFRERMGLVNFRSAKNTLGSQT